MFTKPMKRHILFSVPLGLALLLNASPHATAAVIYESGTLGETGIPWNEIHDQTVFGARVTPDVFNGVRFELTKPIVVSQIGGHFAGPVSDTFFGAIVQLHNENDFPDSGDLSSPDVLGHTLLTFPEFSYEVYGDLPLSLDPGWYALVFGSGLFEATGSGAALLNNSDIGSPTYIGHQPGSGSGWGDLLNPIFRNYRFVVRGQIIPEPAIGSLIPIMVLLLSLNRLREQR